MCTASWILRSEGFDLLFNRDESRARGTAEPPRALVVRGVRAIAPTDPDGGGSWIGANEHGLALCLLNAWGRTADGGRPEPEAPLGGFESRGRLHRALLDAADVEEIEHRLLAAELSAHRGFRLAAFAPGREPRTWSWDGTRLAAEAARAPLVSSSLDEARALRERRVVLQRATGGGPVELEALERFHASHAPERGPWSPCMHRSDARTVSATHVRVAAHAVEVRYAPGSPCETAWEGPIAIERAVVRR